MFDAAYRRRLAADLPEWQKAGFVSAEGATGILAAVESRRSSFGFSAVAALVGGLLVGLGIIAFIAANWDGTPRPLRLLILVLALAVAYGTTAALRVQGLTIFSEASALIGGLVFAASIALVGQAYHLSGEFAGAVALFEIGILGAALLLRSHALIVLGLVGAAVWTYTATFDSNAAPHWWGLLAIFAGAGAAVLADSGPARLATVGATIFWVVVAVISVGEPHNWAFGGALALWAVLALVFFALAAASDAIPDASAARLGNAFAWPALFGLLIALGLLQAARFLHAKHGLGDWLLPAGLAWVVAVALAVFAWRKKALAPVDVAAVAAIGAAAIGFAIILPEDEFLGRVLGAIPVAAAALWCVNLGQRGEPGHARGLGFTALGLEILYLYAVTFGTLLDTALAFVVGGVLFIALAIGLYRLDRRLKPRVAAPG